MSGSTVGRIGRDSWGSSRSPTVPIRTAPCDSSGITWAR